MSEKKKRKTTITISGDTWKRLNSIKRIGESFDKLLSRLLDRLGVCVHNAPNKNLEKEKPPDASGGGRTA